MAQRLIQVGAIKVRGVTLQVIPVQQPKICESEQHSTSTSEASIPPVPVVEVSWSHDDLSEHVLTMYLENKKRSGGGEVKNMRFFKEERKAYVRFIDTECKLLQHFFQLC